MMEAISNVIRLFCQKCHRYHDITGEPPPGAAARANMEEVLQARHELRNYPLIIAIPGRGSGPPQIIRLLYRLRSALAWEGGFLGIVEDVIERQQLMELSLLGEHGGRFQFGDMPGHVALCRPVLLADLLQAVSTMEEMSLEVWYGLLDQCSIGSLLEKVSRAERLMQGGVTQEAAGIVREVLDGMGRIDWLVLLVDAHKDLRLVNNLIETYPPDVPLVETDCPVILEKIRQILLRSSMGGTL